MTPVEPDPISPEEEAPNEDKHASEPPVIEVVEELEDIDEEIPEYEVLEKEPVTEIEQARALTRARARDLRTLVSKYIKRHLPEEESAAGESTDPPRMVGTHARLLPYLQIIPWILAALFGFSFYWDFPGATINLFGTEFALDGLILMLSVSGLIGFFTNWLAITMLFHPRKRRPIFGQGLIPAQRERIIFRLAKAVSEELINEEIIKQKIEESGVIPKYRELALSVMHGVLEDPEFRDDLKALAADYVNSVLSSEEVRQKIVEFSIQKLEEYTSKSLSGLALKAYRFINEDDFQRRMDEAVSQLPSSVDALLDEMDHLLDRVPEKIAERSDEIEDWVTKVVLGFVGNLDVYGMIVSNMRHYDEHQLEALLKNTSNEQLNYIKYLGGVLGFFGGLIIWQPLLAVGVFGSLGVTLFLLDLALFRAKGAN